MDRVKSVICERTGKSLEEKIGIVTDQTQKRSEYFTTIHLVLDNFKNFVWFNQAINPIYIRVGERVRIFYESAAETGKAYEYIPFAAIEVLDEQGGVLNKVVTTGYNFKF